MAQKVTIELDAKDAAMVAAWQRARQSVQAFEDEFKKVGDTTKKNTASFGNWVAKLVSVQSAANLITSSVRSWWQMSQELAREAGEIALKYDEIGRKFQVQSGLKGLEGEQAQARITGAAVRQSFDIDRAQAVATQLVSSGFSAEEASGASLEEFLRILNASNAAGQNVDSAQLAKSITGYLQSQGLELNAENLARIGRGTQRLFKSTNIQLADLVDVAKVGSLLSKGLTPEEQLAAMSVSADLGRPSSESATAFRGVVGSLMGARANEAKVSALKEFGLGVEDVDLVGEGFQDALARLDQGMQAMPEEQRMAALKKLFGEEYAAFALDMISGRKKIAERVGIMTDDRAFMEDVAISTSGPAAGARRLAAQTELEKLERSRGDSTITKAIEAELLDRGHSPWRASMSAKEYEAGRGLGLSQETALAMAVQGEERRQAILARAQAAEQAQGGPSLVFEGKTITDQDEINRLMGELTDALKQNTDATKQNNDATDKNTKQPAGRRNDAQRAPQVPAAALSDR